MRPDPDDAPPLAAADRAAWLRAADAPPATSLVLVSGPACLPAARALARRWAPASDTHLLHPPDGHWRAQDVADVIAAAVGHVPGRRHAAVVASAASLLDRHHDRVLKLLEDPPAPTWFLLCVGDGNVPPTVRGRAAAHLQARPASDQRRTEGLVAAGLDAGTASRVVAAAGRSLDVQDALQHLDERDREGALRHFDDLAAITASGPAPVSRAAAAAGVVDQCAAAVAGHVGSRTAARRLVAGMLLERWAGDAAGALDRDEVPPALVERVERFLHAAAAAAVALDRNVDPAAALARATLATG